MNVLSGSAVGLIALMSLRGLGPTGSEKLAERFGTLDEIVDAKPEWLRGLVGSAVASSLSNGTAMQDAIERASRVLEEAERLNVQVFSVFDDRYPKALKRLQDRPPVIYVKGSLANIERSVACIGTREPTEFGEKVTSAIVEQLVAAKWTIVSGLAVGVDTLSHEAALRAGGRTVAVMAGGLDAIYPRKNAKLAESILDKGGALISEQTFGVAAIPRNLVQRDRLQSGLSVATFVMQTDIKGGSMHTVRFTLLQERLLFAPVPRARHALEPKSQGILAMTQMSAREFGKAASASGNYEHLLMRKFGDFPVAIPLASREDYASMLQILEERQCGIEHGKAISVVQASLI